MSKTARITILSSAAFKSQLQSSAKALGISVSELVRRRFDKGPSEDEALLVLSRRSYAEPLQPPIERYRGFSAKRAAHAVPLSRRPKASTHECSARPLRRYARRLS